MCSTGGHQTNHATHVHSKSIFEAMDIFSVKLGEDIDRSEAIQVDNSPDGSWVFFFVIC